MIRIAITTAAKNAICSTLHEDASEAGLRALNEGGGKKQKFG